MSYNKFAYIYDLLMNEVPYESWASYLKQQLSRYYTEKENEMLQILELGCGTGELLTILSRDKYNLTGIDLSADMLTVASQKLQENGLSNVSLYEQDMTNFELHTNFDCIIIFCDSLNYITDEQNVQATFKQVYKHLQPGGLFLFDVHSSHKIEHILTDGVFADTNDEASYIWHCYAGDLPLMVEHDLTFFIQRENGLYERFEEYHVQRTFEVGAFQTWLQEEGFEMLQVSGDFSDTLTDNDERIFFCARKK
ncbi:class I SAM-dependent methyltransferase [Bacillus sp. HMF5848]|uniref:class I SAM-dependent DNA methyltransferase n=1 Tax=Bacillus sp. HMF5848 TaxID=2495421 RepID=UPI000F793F9C|nr:class I SAM-dependent methyltransferase [Bacillus sp. HMF5848]RSK27918.1 class I SAM-dependent methyltransferase [Bacillus sp. HMF5848]